jgi:hypothetical protein
VTEEQRKGIKGDVEVVVGRPAGTLIIQIQISPTEMLTHIRRE